MATTTADGYSATSYQGQGKMLSCLDVTHEITTGELDANDVINFGVVPKNSIYVYGHLLTDDLDSNGTPTLDLIVGDDDDPDGFLVSGTAGQTAGRTEFAGAYILNQTQVTDDKTISVTVNAAAATAVAGTVRVVLFYYDGT